MANDIYQSKILPDGTVRPIANAARVINPLEPLNDTAKIASNLAMQYKKIELENEQVKQDQFESDLKLRQAQFNNELENITNQQDFDNAIEKYNSDIDTLGNNVLGEKGYNKWSNEKGRNYKALANLGYKSIWAENLQKQNYSNMKVTASNYATLAALDPKRRNDFVAQAEMDIKSKGLTPEQQQTLLNDFKVELANAEVVRDINKNPGVALENLKAIEKDKEDPTKDRPKFYDGLTPVQRQRYIEHAQAKYEAQLNTYNDKMIVDLKREFAEKYEEEGYDSAYNFYKEKTDNLATTAKEYNISQEQLKSFKNWAKDILRDTSKEQGFANQDKFGNLQEKFQGMGITFDRKKGEYKLNIKNKVKVEDVIETINNINAGLNDGTYFMNEKKVKAMREILRTVLGDMVDNGAKLRYTDVKGNKWFKQYETTGNFYYVSDSDLTASEYIKDSILKVLNNKTNVNNFNLEKLTTREKGEIFEHVYESALANNIDLGSYYIDSKKKIDILTRDVFNWMIQNRFDVPQKEYGAVIGDGNMYDTNNPKAKNNIGKKAAGYGGYYLDKNGTLLKFVDKNGNVIDEVKR